jgi:DNA-binding IclR family transcriptional regulator
MKRAYHPPALKRAIRVLELLAESPSALTLSELARSTSCSKSTLHGILRVLESCDWVQKEAGRGGYRLGSGPLDLVRNSFGFWEMPKLAQPLMEGVAERVGESVFLGTPGEEGMVILSCVEGNNEMRVTSPPGTTLPFLAAATAKVLLAGLSREEAQARLEAAPLPRFTERSICEPASFLEEVERVRRLGYATDDEEYLRGVRAVAAPVRHGVETVGAMWVVGLVSSLTDELMERAGKELVQTSEILSRWLSSRPPAQ